MSYNSFGRLFRITTWGESHGKALGCIVDGCPAKIVLTESDIQAWLDKRKPGTSRFVTQRREPDQVKILSGTFEDEAILAQYGGPVTTGTPISLLIENQDQRSKDYGAIAEVFRPGHADMTYQAKYGVRDYRGGGRSSARETAARVAAGAIARKILGPEIKIRGYLTQIGSRAIDRERFDWTEIANNPFFCPDSVTCALWEDDLDKIRKRGSSIGAIVEVQATGVPAGWGSPLYAKLDAEIAAGLMSINAVKGVEIGDGFSVAGLSGEENADEMRKSDNGQILFLSNHAGGILGGLSTGQPIIARLAIKPTSSILTPRLSVDKHGNETKVSTKGRHDPCVGIRAVPVAEAMLACALADAKLCHQGQMGSAGSFHPS